MNRLKKLSAKAPAIALAGFLLMGCQHTEAPPSNPQSETGALPHTATGIKYHEGLLVVGAPRYKVLAAYGPPNGSNIDPNGNIHDVYIFFDDGSKYVSPAPHTRSASLAVVTVGASTAIEQAHASYHGTHLNIYHVYYGPDNVIYRVVKEHGNTVKISPKTT
jgi:hypothetical protein